MRAGPLLVLPLLLLLPLTPVGEANHGQGDATDVYVNVLSVARVGCGDDGGWFEGDPDYRVRVYHEGTLVLDTGKVQGQKEPLFAQAVRLEHPARPVHLRFVVEEAEPGGAFGTGTSWRDCDASPEPGKELQVVWDGTQVAGTYRGDDADAVDLRIAVGTNPPSAATPTTSVQATSATVSWDADPTGRTTTHHVRWSPMGTVFHTAGSSAGSHTLTDLCDNASYSVEVLRSNNDWAIRSEPVLFTTPNLAPQQPQLRWAETGDGNLSVAWYSPTWHDVDRYELFAGPAGFTPGDATLFASVEGEARTPFAKHAWAGTDPGATHVIVRAVDTAGAHADSAPFAVNTDRDLAGPPEYACAHALVDGQYNRFADPDEPISPEESPSRPSPQPTPPSTPPSSPPSPPPPSPPATTPSTPTSPPTTPPQYPSPDPTLTAPQEPSTSGSEPPTQFLIIAVLSLALVLVVVALVVVLSKR